jgi:hypothetical protein
MPRRKKKTSRRRKTFSILNALEAFTYASILSEGTTGGSVYAFVTGASDLGYSKTSLGMGTFGRDQQSLTLTGQGQISLGDIMTEPSLAIDTMASNFQANLLPMALASFTTSIGFRVGRKILRRPLGSISRNILHPVFGKGVRM